MVRFGPGRPWIQAEILRSAIEQAAAIGKSTRMTARPLRMLSRSGYWEKKSILTGRSQGKQKAVFRDYDDEAILRSGCKSQAVVAAVVLTAGLKCSVSPSTNVRFA